MKNTGNEKKIESKLKVLIEVKLKGLCIKFPASFFNGFPDRICLLPGGVIFFVEVKSKDKDPSKLQQLVHKQIRALGFNVYVIDLESQILEIDEIINARKSS